MNVTVKAIVAIATTVAAGLMPLQPSSASTFSAWKVSGVAKGDLLNVRAYPSPKSRILVGYPNGTTLSMTGTCTGGVNLAVIGGQPSWKQRQAVRYKWCQAWLDADGNGEYEPGWVYGRFIRPL